MKLLRTITNKDFSQREIPVTDDYKKRKAVRAVIFNDKDEIAIIPVLNGGYHKIPGGGVETGEELEEALRREVLEEAGVSIEIVTEVGYILEYREGLEQYSYCYLARLVGAIGKPSFTKNEITNGFREPVWLPFAEAIQVFDSDKPTFLRAQFMSLRDGIFVKEASKLK